MIGILDAVKMAAGAALGFAAASLMSMAVWQPQARYEGAAAERAAIMARSIEAMQERAGTDAEIRKMDDASLCSELGGFWVPDENACR
jgi:hypothetical protein